MCCLSLQFSIAVYYESLCPDSARFITEQLHPVRRGPLGRYLDLTLVPYGKASVSRNCLSNSSIADLRANRANSANTDSPCFRLTFPFSFFHEFVRRSVLRRSQFATFGADVNFTCQHGPEECYGNKVHACALQHIQVSGEGN